MRHASGVAVHPELAGRIKAVQLLIPAPAHSLRAVLPVPQVGAGVEGKQLIHPRRVLQRDEILCPVAARHAVPEALRAECRAHALRDAAAPCHDACPAQVEKRLPRNGKALVAAFFHAQAGAAHHLKIGRLVAVYLVDVLLLEEARIAEIAAARRKISSACHIHRKAVRRHAVKYIPVEDVAQFAGVDRVALASPQPVFILADIV